MKIRVRKFWEIYALLAVFGMTAAVVGILNHSVVQCVRGGIALALILLAFFVFDVQIEWKIDADADDEQEPTQ